MSISTKMREFRRAIPIDGRGALAEIRIDRWPPLATLTNARGQLASPIILYLAAHAAAFLLSGQIEIGISTIHLSGGLMPRCRRKDLAEWFANCPANLPPTALPASRLTLEIHRQPSVSAGTAYFGKSNTNTSAAFASWIDTLSSFTSLSASPVFRRTPFTLASPRITCT